MILLPDKKASATAVFRFYAELNDCLPPPLRQRAFAYSFRGAPPVKDAIEAIGVSPAEVDLVVVDGEPASLDRRLLGGERIAVYPMFARLDISPLRRTRVRRF